MIEYVLLLLATFIKTVISSLGYPGIVVLMGIESACVPLPSEIIMPFAGFLVYAGRFSSLAVVATLGAIGCNLGSVLAYEVGAYGGRPLIERFGKYILMNRHDLDVSDRFFQKYGSITVFIGRLLPVVRTFISTPSPAPGPGATRWLIAATLSACAGTAIRASSSGCIALTP
jgi:membrane protein DedA with SNARE-associated domain